VSSQTPLEEILEKRGTPGPSSLPVLFLELFELKDVLPMENEDGQPVSHS
jgi:hypothetical protein